MSSHEPLLELFHEAETCKPKSEEWIKVRTRMNQYLLQLQLFNDYSVPNRMLLQFIWLGFRKDGFRTSLKGLFQGVARAISWLRS